jgi:osmotically-inducible protein OsmY
MLAHIAPTADHTLVLAGNTASPAVGRSRDVETTRCVATRLCRCGYVAIRDSLTCDCRNGVLTLMGELPSFFLVQVAQNVAIHAPGVRQVVNRIRVG